MGIFSSILGAVAGPLVKGVAGKIFGKDEPQTTTSRVNYKQLRDDARAAGFNPLTALRATGGTGNVTTTTPVLSSYDFMADALGKGVETAFNYKKIQRDEEVEQIRLETMKEELARLKRQDQTKPKFGYDLTEVVEDYTGPDALGPKLGMANKRPQARKGLADYPTVRVFLPDGQPRAIPKPVADRLDLVPNGYIAAGDYAELVGEIRGEGETALNYDSIGDAVGVPMFKGSSVGDYLPSLSLPEWASSPSPTVGSAGRRQRRAN